MKNIYIREITRREPTNYYGKLGFVSHTEVLINPPTHVLAEANYKKHIRFFLVATLPGDYFREDVVDWLSDRGYKNINVLYE